MFDSGAFVHTVIQGSRPQTFAYRLTGSPVGQLAWVVDATRGLQHHP